MNIHIFIDMERSRIYLVLLLIGLLFSIRSFGQEQIQLRWDPSTDNVGVEGYNVWLDGLYYGTTSDTAFIISLDIGTYALAVSAFDAAGNESDKSEVLMVTIGDVETPTIPDGLIIVYPNPTYGDFRVDITRPLLPNSMMRIIQPNGQIVYQRPIQDYERAHTEFFELSSFLNQGWYIIDVIEDGQRVGHSHLLVTETPGMLTMN